MFNALNPKKDPNGENGINQPSNTINDEESSRNLLGVL